MKNCRNYHMLYITLICFNTSQTLNNLSEPLNYIHYELIIVKYLLIHLKDAYIALYCQEYCQTQAHPIVLL